MAEQQIQPPRESRAEGEIPPGFNLRSTLRGHEGWINRVVWSLDGCILGSASGDTMIRFWNVPGRRARC